MKVTVSKLQIAQAKECGQRADKYIKGLETIISMCKIVMPIANYNKMPDEFKRSHKKNMNTILNDFKSMRDDARILSDKEWNKAKELEAKRNVQLSGEKQYD